MLPVTRPLHCSGCYLPCATCSGPFPALLGLGAVDGNIADRSYHSIRITDGDLIRSDC